MQSPKQGGGHPRAQHGALAVHGGNGGPLLQHLISGHSCGGCSFSSGCDSHNHGQVMLQPEEEDLLFHFRFQQPPLERTFIALQ